MVGPEEGGEEEDLSILVSFHNFKIGKIPERIPRKTSVHTLHKGFPTMRRRRPQATQRKANILKN